MSSKQILDYLDRCDFPMLDNGYYYHVDQKMSILKNDSDWVILLQILAFNNHELGVHGMSTVVYTYGNLIHPDKAFENDGFFHFAEDFDCKTFVKEENRFISFLNPKAKYFRVRNQLIPIEHDLKKYEKKGIALDENKITPWDLMRFVCPEYSEYFWVTREEIATKVPMEMKEVATFSDWQHPDMIKESPSDAESFQLIANYLESGDKNEIEKIRSGNTHWKNWLEGGTL